MQDKIALLMEETGCERGEAELALEMSGFQVEEAVKAIARLLKNIFVLKGRFMHPDHDQFGLFLFVANLKNGTLLRSRAVLSYNPAIYGVPLEKDWFEFEKQLYGCRLWEGSLQAESLEIEQALAAFARQAGQPGLSALSAGSQTELLGVVGALFKDLFRAPVLKLQLKREILDLGQFRALRSDPEKARTGHRETSRPPGEDLLVLRIALEEDAEGVPCAQLRSGDTVAALITDARDIAQYLARLFGGHSEKGPVPVLVPIEAIESAPDGVLARVRFSVGVVGDCRMPRERRLRVVRRPQDKTGAEAKPWWRRLF